MSMVLAYRALAVFWKADSSCSCLLSSWRLVQVGRLSVLKLEKYTPPSSSQTMPFRALLMLVTDTAHSPFFSMSLLAVAVIVATPAPTAVTLPASSTVATLGSELVQVTLRSPAVRGWTLTVRSAVLPL